MRVIGGYPMKVICDVCGTTFPETATHCPICGCAKSPAAQTVNAEDVQANPETTTVNTYSRGGRFSKNNVKRNSRARASEGRYSGDRKRQNDSQQGNKGLIAVVIVLLLAIVMVVVYIGVNVFLSDLGGSVNNGGNVQTSSTPDNGGNGNQDGQEIPCTAIQLNCKVIAFDKEETIELVVIKKEPENTTDTVTYSSADPEIATVDANGMVKPGTKQGETVITVTCGTVTEECKIISTVGEAPVSSVPESQGPVLPDGFVLKLETYKGSGEITIAAEGASHQLYKEIMGIKSSDITWTTSDPAVATVENGKVVGVDRGTCTITATIGDQTATCFVRCPFDKAPETDYELSHVSVTIGKGETFNLSLKSKSTGANVQGVEWTASKEGIVQINGNKITGGTVSTLTLVEISTEYEGNKYTCKVYVKVPEE